MSAPPRLGVLVCATKASLDHHRNNRYPVMCNLQVQRNLCTPHLNVLTAVGSTVTKTVSTKTTVVGNTVTVSTEITVVGNTVTVSTETTVVGNTVTVTVSTEITVVGNTVTVSTETTVVGNTVTASTETTVSQQQNTPSSTISLFTQVLRFDPTHFL